MTLLPSGLTDTIGDGNGRKLIKSEQFVAFVAILDWLFAEKSISLVT
jgi:hypothetical protein